MSNWTLTARSELRQTLRDGRVRIALITLFALFVTTLAVGAAQQSRYESNVSAAVQGDRLQQLSRH